MMKPLTLSLATLTLTGAMATTALADDGSVSREQLDTLLQSAGEYGFTHFDEFGVDDGNRFEVEGWRDDGWQLDIDMQLSGGSVIREEQRKSEIPDWSLSGDDVTRALDSAQASGLQQFGSFDVDRTGDIEIEGYDDQQREVEVRMTRDTFEVTGVNHDD